MISIKYNHPDIRVETKEVSKILDLPLRCSIISHVGKKEIWGCELNDNSWATYANDSIFDIRIQDKFGNTILYREYNVLEDGSELDKSLYLYSIPNSSSCPTTSARHFCGSASNTPPAGCR